MAAASEVFSRHVERFNACVHTGDFGPMLAGFAEDARLRFLGVPVAPLDGRKAIAAAYRERPPDDEIRVLQVLEAGREHVIARYAWSAQPEIPAGTMWMTAADGLVSELIVTFDPA
jgi:steroid Delta-isomerase